MNKGRLEGAPCQLLRLISKREAQKAIRGFAAHPGEDVSLSPAEEEILRLYYAEERRGIVHTSDWGKYIATLKSVYDRTQASKNVPNRSA